LLPGLFALALFGAVAAEAQQTAPAATGGGPAATTPANPDRLTAAEAQHAIDLLQDPKQRAGLIEALRAIAKTPVPAEPEKPPASAAPGAAASSVALAPDSLGAQLVAQFSTWPERLAGEAAVAARAVAD